MEVLGCVLNISWQFITPDRQISKRCGVVDNKWCSLWIKLYFTVWTLELLFKLKIPMLENEWKGIMWKFKCRSHQNNILSHGGYYGSQIYGTDLWGGLVVSFLDTRYYPILLTVSQKQGTYESCYPIYIKFYRV